MNALPNSRRRSGGKMHLAAGEQTRRQRRRRRAHLCLEAPFSSEEREGELASEGREGQEIKKPAAAGL